MKKIVTLFVFLFTIIWKGFVSESLAQQDPQYSQYMFNQMALNPAYAGSKEALSAVALYRTQWTGIDGAPITQTLTLHAPLKKKKVGLGFAVIADQIGPKKSVGGLFSYSYRIPIKNGWLAMGLRAGVYNFTYNWAKIDYKDQADVYNTQNRTSIIVPTADAGLYYYTNTFYLGISATHLYNGRLTTVSNSNGDDAKLSPHYFITAGKAWGLSDNFVFNPSIVIKSAKNAPVNADLNFSFLMKQKIWAGLSFRSSRAVVIYAQVLITDKLKFGYALDVSGSKIGRVGGGSHEIMLGYDFNIYKSKIISPRYL